MDSRLKWIKAPGIWTWDERNMPVPADKTAEEYYNANRHKIEWFRCTAFNLGLEAPREKIYKN